MLPLIRQLYTRMKFSSNHSPQSQDHFFLVNQFQLRPCLHIYGIRLFTLTWIILHILTLNSIGWLFDQSDQLAGMEQAGFFPTTRGTDALLVDWSVGHQEKKVELPRSSSPLWWEKYVNLIKTLYETRYLSTLTSTVYSERHSDTF